MQVPDSDITVRHGHVEDTIIMQCRSGKILLYYSVEPFYYRCLDELVSLQKRNATCSNPHTSQSAAPFVVSMTNHLLFLNGPMGSYVIGSHQKLKLCEIS